MLSMKSGCRLATGRLQAPVEADVEQLRQHQREVNLQDLAIDSAFQLRWKTTAHCRVIHKDLRASDPGRLRLATRSRPVVRGDTAVFPVAPKSTPGQGGSLHLP